MTQKAAAELRREKSEIEAKRLKIRKECEQHRSTYTTEEMSSRAKELQTLSDRLDEINTELVDAPAPEERGRGFNPPAGHELTAENYRSSEKYRDAFFRSHTTGKIAEADREIMAFGKRAVTDMNGGSVTSGGEYLVPLGTLGMISAIVTKYGALYAKITKYRFNGDVSLPIGTAGSVTNNADGTDTLTFTFTEVTINQMAIVATVSVKNLLMKNSISGLETFLAMEIGKYIGLMLENYLINGSLSTSKFLGLVTALTASAVEYGDDPDWDLVNDVQGAVDSPYGDAGEWIMTRKTFFTKFRSITDANGQPIASITSGGSGSTTYAIDGRPVNFTSRMTDGHFIFGDLSQYIGNESQELVIEADASAGFAGDNTIWRGKVYAGGQPMFATTAFIYYKPAA